MTDELPDLTDLTVDEQEDELENLSKEQLKDLREQEDRRSAIDNIDMELKDRPDSDSETDDEEDDPVEDDPTDNKPEPAEPDHIRPEPDPEHAEADDNRGRVAELEAKVDYVIEKCKTTSMQGFEEYDNQ